MTHVLWRRLDVPGRDACRLVEDARGYALEGSAVFAENGVVSCLTYRVSCDRNWQSQTGQVSGWVGGRSVEYYATQTREGVWTLNGREYPELAGCADFDLGFTPATNLLQLRRVNLQPGAAADVPAAWLDADAGTLTHLTQRYERQSEDAYAYASPTASYEAVLRVTPSGFVRSYPGLWELELSSD